MQTLNMKISKTQCKELYHVLFTKYCNAGRLYKISTELPITVTHTDMYLCKVWVQCPSEWLSCGTTSSKLIYVDFINEL